MPGDTGWQTGGVDQRVEWARVQGQVTCLESLSTGAAKSEPQQVSRRRRRRGAAMLVGPQPAVVRVVYPGWQGGRVGAGYAHYTRWDECIYGVLDGPFRALARAGAGQNSTRTSTRTVPGPGPEQCHTRPTTRPPTQPNQPTDHPTPRTWPEKYPRYLVTQW